MKARFGELDAVRTVFLLQGVLIHALHPYHDGALWVIDSPDKIVGLSSFVNWLHSFRMHGFFLISGIVSWLMLEKRQTTEFLSTRLRRLLVPLASMMLLVNPLEILITNQIWVLTGDTRPPRAFPVWGHLWFLVYLAIYTSLLPVFRSAIMDSRLVRWATKADGGRLDALALAFVLLVSFGAMAVGRTSPTWWWQVHLGVIHPIYLAQYGAYFGAGVLLARLSKVERLHSRPSFLWLLYAVVGWIAAGMIGKADFPGNYSLATLVMQGYALAILRIVFFLAHKVTKGVLSPFALRLVEASYSVYLLHLIVVLTVSGFFLRLSWHPLFEIVFIVAIGFFVSLAIHRFVIRPNRLLSYLFLGEPWPFATRLPVQGSAAKEP